MRKEAVFLSIILGLWLQSCQWFGPLNEDKEPVARVGDSYLFWEDIAEQVPSTYSPEDSIKRIKELAQRWIEQQVIVQQAELNLTEERKDFDKKLTDYRNSLLIYAYESEYVDQKLDTGVTDREIVSYYEAHKEDFELKDYIVKIRYVKLNKNAPKKNKLKRELFKPGQYDVAFVEDYCFQFAANYLLEEEIWLYFDELKREIPIGASNPEQFLRNTKQLELETEEFDYLLNILDYRLKDDVSPLEFEQEKIKQIIINQRKLELITSLRNDILNEAYTKNQAAILIE